MEALGYDELIDSSERTTVLITCVSTIAKEGEEVGAYRRRDLY